MYEVMKIATLTLSRSPSPAATQMFFGCLAIGRGTDLKCGSTPIEPIKGIDYGINNEYCSLSRLYVSSIHPLSKPSCLHNDLSIITPGSSLILILCQRLAKLAVVSSFTVAITPRSC
jgi:hypothetical protein